MCRNIGTPKENQFSIWNKWKINGLGVPIFKQSRVFPFICNNQNICG